MTEPLFAMQRPVRPENGGLFYSPLGLFGFQADAVAETYVLGNRVGVIDRGLGKTVIMMALAAMLFADDEIDLVINVAQANKLTEDEFPADWREFTSLRVVKYLGANRDAKLAKAADAGLDVVLTSYETGAKALMQWEKKTNSRSKGSRADGPLFEQLDLRNKRVLWLFDECVKLGSRSTEVWRSYDYALTQLRKTGNRQRVFGLSANPMSTDWIQSENIALIVDPTVVPPITKFKHEFTNGIDDSGNLVYNQRCRDVFVPMVQKLFFRKRSSDSDVKIPVPLESLVDVALDPMQRQLYEAVQGILGPYDELTDSEKGQVVSALRLVAGHPASLPRSDGRIAKAVTEELGAEFLASVPSAKTKRLLADLDGLRGRQVMIFTFYSQTVLPELLRELTDAGHLVGCYTDPNDRASQLAIQMFKAGQIHVLLSGDAGARGLNLPEAEYIIEYESAKTFETRMQRFGRGTRITSDAEHVYAITYVARQTVEVGTLRKVLERNEKQDHLLGDAGVDGYVTAADRKRTLEASR